MNHKNKDDYISLRGLFPPVPTPFAGNEKLALTHLKNNLTHLNNFDLQGYVILGSNGEFVMLTEKEKIEVLNTARAAIPSDKLMIAGTGCQSTQETVRLTKLAAGIGANAALIITPSYYKRQMSSDVLINHYLEVAKESPIPIIIYNMPACTGIDLTAETVATMAKNPNIIGIKDSGGNITKMAEIMRATGSNFQILAGSGGFLLPALSVGARGGVMALAIIAPDQCQQILEYFQKGDHQKAQNLQVKLVPVNAAVTSRWGVPALKAAMDYLGMYGGPVRLPLAPISEEIKQQLYAILEENEIKKV
jgi:4-hydroxy-2-oxoglutarate aldolase